MRISPRTPAQRLSSRLRVAITLAMLLTAVLSATGPTAQARLAADVTVERLGGPTRYETAVRISQETFPGQLHGAWLARGDLFPDALAASYAAKAGSGGGPILLTPPDELHPAVRDELRRTDIQLVYIAGDASAISHGVEAEIQAMGIDTHRAAGADRFATARSVAATAPNNNYGTAIIVTGLDFADALAAGPIAYARYMPIFLTTPDRLHEQAANGLYEQGIHHVIIVGGTSAVSEQVRRDIENFCPFDGGGCITTSRIGGRNRTETAALLADELVRQVRENVDPGHVPTHVNLARGDTFPDATAGGPHGGQETAPILLTADPHTLGDATRAWLEKHAATIESIHVFGTRDAISNEVVEEARQAASTP